MANIHSEIDVDVSYVASKINEQCHHLKDSDDLADYVSCFKSLF